MKPGETFYSALFAQGAQVIRRDYAADAWEGPPQGVLGWWRSQLPSPHSKRQHWAPNDVMLELLDELHSQPERLDMRYVLSLLLVRRRVLRLEETERDELDREVSVLYCPRRETTYKVVSIVPSAERQTQIQEELARLLVAEG